MSDFAGNSGIVADVDEARNLFAYNFVPGYPTSGGFYSVAGFTTGIVAAALAANTTLAAITFWERSARIFYLRGMHVKMNISTAGLAGAIPTVLGLQRYFSGAAVPSGGTARIIDRTSDLKDTASDVTDIRDSNAALTTTGLTFGTVIAVENVPNNSTNNTPFDWIIDFPSPIEVLAGNGLALRTQKVGPATATWGFSYVFYWGER